eukprot:4190760-Amphidinium_carterae.3
MEPLTSICRPHRHGLGFCYSEAFIRRCSSVPRWGWVIWGKARGSRSAEVTEFRSVGGIWCKDTAVFLLCQIAFTLGELMRAKG